MFEEAIVISRDTETGQFQTRIDLSLVNDTLAAGMMLASATRVPGLAFAEDNRSKVIEEQAIAEIQKTYNNDLVMGDLGEAEDFYREDG